MVRGKFLPTSRLGGWGALILVISLVVGVLSVGISFFLRSSEPVQAPNVLGPLVPFFLLLTVMGIVVSWIAVAKKKDRSILLITVTTVATLGMLFVVLNEFVFPLFT
jgi:vacuolar-type H+-ATPase subunit I/STV1